ncbi:MAG: hypothetical protein J6Y72_00230 [Bacteroidales bacterium]|jgi:hypothetical protein|nr:hypothetical protein [Bacteroidales bacterium]
MLSAILTLIMAWGIFTGRIKNNCRPGGGYLPDNNDGCNANDSGNAFDGGCDGGC